ncbi:MAG: response regulator [Clostridia bacterium]|nr:response regulator [Clostridia bacterium]
MKTIVIVDDVEVNRAVLKEVFKHEYAIVEACDGEEALQMIRKYQDSLVMVLLDIIMPKVNGIEVVKQMKEWNMLEQIPVILITEDGSWKMRDIGYTLGVSDIIGKPIEASVTKKRVQNIISLFQHKNEQERLIKKQTEELITKSRMLNEINNRIIDTLGTVVEFRSMESGLHVFRIKHFTKILLSYVQSMYPEYGITDEMANMITAASSLHDVGKISIPDSVLLKPGRLTNEEFELMKTHSMRGYDVIEAIKPIDGSAFFDCARDIAKYHHEKYDGRGYPEGLVGDEIPISAQIVSIADVYDALTHERCYKKAYLPEIALDMIYNGECGAFNPKLINCLKAASEEFTEFIEHSEHAGTDD